ncbi:MAG: host attachment protein [Brevundimonas sp.]|uniref:host attachment protein n=1 Tax=Brevundimonas sp. TaxID=1871086 RepID=UPI0017DC182A|nr:host attachment protein [Brevundimonas sp.]MBA4805361.1 host attachment protein [Brevundimonas sp.]
MPARRTALFVIADGGRARLVARDPESRDFRTLREIDGLEALEAVREAARRNPSVRSVQSATGVGHTTGQEDPYRPAKAAFAAEVAAAAVEASRARGDHGLILVAPARTLASLREAIGKVAPIVADLDRDLVKAPDAELERWLAPLERALTAVTPRD